MSWSYSQVLVAEFLEVNCLDTEQYAQLSSTPMPDQYYSHGKPTEHSRLSRFGMTCEPLTDDLGEELLTWFREGSLAKTSASPEKEQELTENDQDSGERWRGWWAKYDPVTCSWKTAQLSLLGDLIESSVIFPRSGMTRGGLLWELPMLERPTNVIGCGYFLPTPSGTSNHGKNHVSGRLDEWGGSSNIWRGTATGKISCPNFEEWVMGWPVRFTELTPLETVKSLSAEQQHGESLVGLEL